MKLIDKDALVAEIEERRDSLISLSESCPANTVAKSGFYAQAQTLEGIKNFLGTLEVKEVDLDFQRFAKQMDAVFALPSSETENTEEEPLNWEYAIAKHFFELGFKTAQKGEEV